MTTIQLKGVEVDFLRVLVKIGEASYSDESLRDGAPRGFIREVRLAQELDQWDAEKAEPTPGFHRIMRLLNHIGLAECRSIPVNAGYIPAWGPSVTAISEVRRIEAEEKKSRLTKLAEWLGIHLKMGLEQSVQKSVYLALSAIFGLGGGFLAAWIMQSC